VLRGRARERERTCARTIERALQEMVRRAKVRGIQQPAGSGLWTGRLSQTRGDAPVAREREELASVMRRSLRLLARAASMDCGLSA
jgi:hypothetical protein